MSAQTITERFANRAVTLARRKVGVTRVELKKFNKSVGWFTYLQRAAFETETVESRNIDGVTTYFVR
jgi:hypothetical protein